MCVFRGDVFFDLVAHVIERLQFRKHALDRFVRKGEDARFGFGCVGNVVVPIPCVFQGGAGTHVFLHRVAETFDVLDRLQRVVPLGRAHGDEDFLVYFLEGGRFRLACLFFRDEAQRVGIDGF